MRTYLFSFVLGVGILVAPGHVSAQRGGGQAADPAAVPAVVRSANMRLAGTWKLIGEEVAGAKGAITRRTGRLGYLVYDPAGYMAVTVATPDRPAFAGRQPTPQEASDAMDAYTAYFGSFAIDEAAGTVTHQTFGALDTAASGMNEVRGFTISGNRLVLRPASASGNQSSSTWERLPDLPNLTPTHRKVIGVWKLILMETRSAAGEQLSSSPGQTGFIVYTASGHVLVNMMQPYRRRPAAAVPTTEEIMATYRSYTTYFGPYTVNESEKYFVHHLAGALNPGPGGVGSDFQRFFEFPGRRLILRLPMTGNGDGRKTMITWERLSD